MSVREKISQVVDKWFLYEPLMFNVYCTHKLEPNSDMKCPFRTGKRRIEYNPELLKDSTTDEIAQGLKTEVTKTVKAKNTSVKASKSSKPKSSSASSSSGNARVSVRRQRH